MIYGNRFLNYNILNESQMSKDEYKEYEKIVKNMINIWISQINISKVYLNKIIKLFNNPKDNINEMDKLLNSYEDEYNNSRDGDNFIQYKKKYGIIKIKDKKVINQYKEKINELSKLNNYFNDEEILNKLKSKYDESEKMKCQVIYDTYFDEVYNKFKTDIESTIHGIKQFI